MQEVKIGRPQLGQDAGSTSTRPITYNRDAEAAVLGSILIDNDAIHTIHFLQAEDFYLPQYRWVYEQMLWLAEKGQPIDIVTLAYRLGSMGVEVDESTLVDLISIVPTSIAVKSYARIVQTESIKRQIINACSQIVKHTYEANGDGSGDDLIADAESRFLKIRQIEQKESTVDVSDLALSILNRMESGVSSEHLKTDFLDLDVLLGGGFSPADHGLVVVAGRPGMGKTSLLLNFTMAFARKGHGVLIFNFEMSPEQLVTRMVAAETRITSDSLKSTIDELGNHEIPILYETIGSISQLPIKIARTMAMVNHVRNEVIRANMQRHPVKVVIIDYLQLMYVDGKHQNRNIEIGIITRSLKELSRELGVVIILGSQLSRNIEQRKDKRPMLSDLRDSGSIEADADLVMFIYRDEYYNPDITERPNIAEISVAKNREGQTGIIDLYWNRKLATFKNLRRQTIDLGAVGQSSDKYD